MNIFKSLFLILLICLLSSCTVFKKESSSKDYLYENHLKGVDLDPHSLAQALPLLFIYLDYIKNNRCTPRKDLFDLFFNQMMDDHTKVRPLLKNICQKVKNIKSCELISHFKIKRSKHNVGPLSPGYFKEIFLTNLIIEEFSNSSGNPLNSIQKNHLKYINPDKDYWFELTERFNSKKTESPFFFHIRENKPLCLHLYDRHVTFRLKDIFANKFYIYIDRILKLKKRGPKNRYRATQKKIWEELSRDIYKFQGKKQVTKNLLKNTALFCQLSSEDLTCNELNSLSCFFLKHKDLKCVNK